MGRRTASALVLVISVVLLAACGDNGGEAASPTPTLPGGTVAVPLDPVPYDLIVPEELASRLSTGPLEDQAFLEDVVAAGATSSVEVRFAPSEGAPITFMTAYVFPEAAFDAAQSPDSPPPYGEEVRREGGQVFSVRGPFDMPFDPNSEDGRAWGDLFALIYSPDSYRTT